LQLKMQLTRIQIIILLLFSWYSIGTIDYRFLLCILAITIVTFVLGIFMDNSQKQKIRKSVCAIGCLIAILMLCYFKYSNFFLSSLSSIFQKSYTTLNIILPVGISFYTFTVIAYLCDVYRNKYAAEKNFIDFALYITFFTKLTAGPIVRGKEFLPQIKEYRGIRWNEVLVGIQIFVFGLFKKIVLADRLGVFVNDVFYAPAAYHSLTVILAVISYSLQIYFDFAGYSDMAIGLSKILGFEFSRNFNLPYLAKNVSEFWKRWHISLSSWFQEYLYYPLGGNRKGTARTYVNLILVMLVSGLWHGAGITFILWGFCYGLASCIHKIWRTYISGKGETKEKSRSWAMFSDVVKVILNFSLVSLLWIIFRANSFQTAWKVIKGMFSWQDGILQMYTWSFFAIVCLIVASVVAIVRAKKHGENYVDGFYPVLNLKKFIPLVIFFTFTGLTIILGYFGNNAFIYGKF